jgi:hypothetical protein
VIYFTTHDFFFLFCVDFAKQSPSIFSMRTYHKAVRAFLPSPPFFSFLSIAGDTCHSTTVGHFLCDIMLRHQRKIIVNGQVVLATKNKQVQRYLTMLYFVTATFQNLVTLPSRAPNKSNDSVTLRTHLEGAHQLIYFQPMDSSSHTDNGQNSLPPTPGGSRKRSRENETNSQKNKREKAAERQRRKRQRDRDAANMGLVAFPQTDDQQQPPPPTPPEFTGEVMNPQEAARRDRVRAAARERQRKHRQLVKQRKMRELGLDMGNEIMPGMEEMHYRVNADGQYQQVLPHDMPHNPHTIVHHEPPFPHGQPLGGQTFATTLLLSFSCAPLLKQHLLRTLVMTNEELASLEPILAEAWDRWDHQVCVFC